LESCNLPTLASRRRYRIVIPALESVLSEAWGTLQGWSLATKAVEENAKKARSMHLLPVQGYWGVPGQPQPFPTETAGVIPVRDGEKNCGDAEMCIKYSSGYFFLYENFNVFAYIWFG